MSIEMNVNVDNVVTDHVKDKVMRTLPAKYNKFAGFAYWLLGQMKDAQVLSANGYDDTCVMMNLLSGDIPMQIEFYEKFFTEAPVSGRLMKAEMKTFKDKSSKKEKKDKKKYLVKEKKSNIVISNTNNDIISQIVMLANSVETIEQPVIEQPIVVEKKKRVKKDKVVLASAVEPTELASIEVPSAVEPTELASVEVPSAVEPSAVELPVVDKKKRVKNNSHNLNHKISKKNKISNIESNNSHELILNQVTIDDISYFYDSNNNLYNNDTLIIGSFDPISLSISIS